MKGVCGFHLPGNRQCPYQALYDVSWIQNQPTAKLPMVHRFVCVHHLVPAIDQALESSPRAMDVHVGMLDEFGGVGQRGR